MGLEGSGSVCSAAYTARARAQKRFSFVWCVNTIARATGVLAVDVGKR